MSQILDNAPNDRDSNIICCYVNATSQIQIARITNVPEWYFERVVFPGQRLVFEAPLDGILEIHSGMMASAILSDTVPCRRLSLHATDSEQDQTNKSYRPVSINESAMNHQVSQSIDIAV